MANHAEGMSQPSFRGLFTTSAGLLAFALLVVELVGGIQTYVTSTVTPLAAAELSGRGLYGIVQGASQVGLFATLPLGAYLASRYDRSRLLLVFTAVAIIGAAVGAVAPTMIWYAAGRGVTGLAAGALATIAMNVVATSLPREWRRLVLAGYAGMWVITSLVGPLYASWISTLVGWRWTMVLYLPLLIGARFLVAQHLPAPGSEKAPAKESLNAPASLALAMGIALFATAGSHWRVSVVLVPIGLVAVLFAAHSLLPSGTYRLSRGRPSAIAILGILTSAYFGSSAVITIAGHDLLKLDPLGIGVLLTLGGLSWAVVGFITGRRPSPTDRGFLTRVGLGGTIITASLAAIAICPQFGNNAVSLVALFVGWAGAGAGMGLCYLELLSRIFDQPTPGDGITVPQAASAAVMVEMITTAVASTATTTAFSTGSTVAILTAVFTALAAMAVFIVTLLPRTITAHSLSKSP